MSGLTLDKVCLNTEQVLNIVGYVPFISKFSAVARALAGTAQVVAGLAVALFALFAIAYHKIKGNQEGIDNNVILLKNSLNYVGQGVLNFGRSCIEYVPFLPLITCLPYDFFGTRHDFKVLKYPTEEIVESYIFESKK